MKKYKGFYTPPEGSNIEESFGIDIEEQLTKMLSDELAKSIDRDILKNLGVWLNEGINHKRKRAIEKIRGY
jgi:hypothetical protein